jgi:hypothetical protein
MRCVDGWPQWGVNVEATVRYHPRANATRRRTTLPEPAAVTAYRARSKVAVELILDLVEERVNHAAARASPLPALAFDAQASKAEAGLGTAPAGRFLSEVVVNRHRRAHVVNPPIRPDDAEQRDGVVERRAWADALAWSH